MRARPMEVKRVIGVRLGILSAGDPKNSDKKPPEKESKVPGHIFIAAGSFQLNTVWYR